jgi:hypothetical protein
MYCPRGGLSDSAIFAKRFCGRFYLQTEFHLKLDRRKMCNTNITTIIFLIWSLSQSGRSRLRSKMAHLVICTSSIGTFLCQLGGSNHTQKRPNPKFYLQKIWPSGHEILKQILKIRLNTETKYLGFGRVWAPFKSHG